MQHRARDLAEKMRDGCLGVRISRLHRLVAREFEHALRPVGLTLPQLEVLAVLMLRGSVKPTVVADALAVERSTISRNLSVMEQKGWVAIESLPSGRAASVAITQDGVAVLARAKTAWARAQGDVIVQLGVNTPATIDSWLDALSPEARG
jgi:DNA-binding MarR family transcriptional regulator